MSKNIKRFIISGALLFAFMTAASASECDDVKTVIPEMKWDFKELKVVTNQGTRELDSYVNNGSNNSRKAPAVLGLFKPKYTFSLHPTVLRTESAGKTCYRLKEANIVFKVEPTIFLSREAMQFACTKARVYRHELKHYNIEIEALNKVPEFIKTYLPKKLEKLNYTSKETFDRDVQIITNEIVKDIHGFIKMHTKFDHADLDTPENYKYEESQCDEQENEDLYELIRNGNSSLR